MDSKELTEYIDQNRWLLNNGLITDGVKNQLFMSGSIVHRDVQAVELDIVADKKLVNYKIYINDNLIKAIESYNALSKSTSLFGMWRFKRLLKKHGTLNFQSMLDRLVKDFCGPSWSTSVEVIDFNKYVEGSGEESETDGKSGQPNQLLNK